MDSKIPVPVMGVISEIFDQFYTHADIDRQFAYADAPGDPPEANKVKKTLEWLRRTNKLSNAPLEVLGSLLEDIMERELSEYGSGWQSGSEWVEKHSGFKERIAAALGKAGLSYSSGGHIRSGSATPTASLDEMVSMSGLKAVEIEMKRALKQVEDDPNAAVQYAGNVLEAAFKAYLKKKGVSFNESSDTLNDLWALTRDDLGINPKDLEAKDLKKIASGLGSIVDGTMYLRNKRSGAHGRTEQEHIASAIRPRHARLVIHSAHTLAAYVLECLVDHQ